MKKMQSQSTSNPTSISQYAAAAALNGDQSCIDTMIAAFKERHDYLVNALNDIDGVDCVPGDGTFYAFAHIEGLMSKAKVSSDVELCEKLLTEANVALVPGSAFGTDGYCRLSFATSMEILKEAIKRISSFSESL
jgi:aspartate aminotransferase